jgi:hypothetical protein
MYLAVYYLCHLQMSRSSSCLSSARTDMTVSSIPLLLYKNLEMEEARDVNP